MCNRAKSEWMVWGTFLSNYVTSGGVTFVRVDLTKYKEIKGFFQEINPDAVIHAAAAARPDFCEENRSLSFKINTEAAINVAGLCADLEVPCLFTSTDLVFDGLNPPYTEQDEPSPICSYGEQKILAETGMKERYPQAVICRLPLMFGDPGPAATNFVIPLLKVLRSGKEVDLFVDEFRTPLSGNDAAEGVLLALEVMPEIIHLGGTERISRYEFGILLADIFRISDAHIRPCFQKDFEVIAPRPPDVSLDISQAKAFGFKPKSLRQGLETIRDVIGR